MMTIQDLRKMSDGEFKVWCERKTTKKELISILRDERYVGLSKYTAKELKEFVIDLACFNETTLKKEERVDGSMLDLLNSVMGNKDAFDFILERMTTKELKAVLKEAGVKGYSKMKKEELKKVVTNSVYGIEVDNETTAVALPNLDRYIYRDYELDEDELHLYNDRYISGCEYFEVLNENNLLKLQCLHLPYSLKKFMYKLIDADCFNTSNVWATVGNKHKEVYVQLLRTFHSDTSDKSNTRLFNYVRESYKRYVEDLEYYGSDFYTCEV